MQNKPMGRPTGERAAGAATAAPFFLPLFAIVYVHLISVLLPLLLLVSQAKIASETIVCNMLHQSTFY